MVDTQRNRYRLQANPSITERTSDLRGQGRQQRKSMNPLSAYRPRKERPSAYGENLFPTPRTTAAVFFELFFRNQTCRAGRSDTRLNPSGNWRVEPVGSMNALIQRPQVAFGKSCEHQIGIRRTRCAWKSPTCPASSVWKNRRSLSANGLGIEARNLRALSGWSRIQGWPGLRTFPDVDASAMATPSSGSIDSDIPSVSLKFRPVPRARVV